MALTAQQRADLAAVHGVYAAGMQVSMLDAKCVTEKIQTWQLLGLLIFLLSGCRMPLQTGICASSMHGVKASR